MTQEETIERLKELGCEFQEKPEILLGGFSTDIVYKPEIRLISNSKRNEAYVFSPNYMTDIISFNDALEEMYKLVIKEKFGI